MHKLMCVFNFFDQSHAAFILKHLLNTHTAFLSFIQNVLLKYFPSNAFFPPGEIWNNFVNLSLNFSLKARYSFFKLRYSQVPIHSDK